MVRLFESAVSEYDMDRILSYIYRNSEISTKTYIFLNMKLN